MSQSGEHWKSVDPRWSEVDALIDTKLLGPDDALAGCLKRSADAGLPDIAVSAAQGRFLEQIVRLMNAQRVLEIGTLGGFSTIHLARGLGEGGKVVSLEFEPAYAEVARVNIASAGVADHVEVITGAALDTLPNLDGPFDLTFIDADKVNNIYYVEHALRLSRPGALIIVDNVVREGNVLAPEADDESAIATREVYDWVAEQPNLYASALQTVGDKGWDGMMFLEVGR